MADLYSLVQRTIHSSARTEIATLEIRRQIADLREVVKDLALRRRGPSVQDLIRVLNAGPEARRAIKFPITWCVRQIQTFLLISCLLKRIDVVCSYQLGRVRGCNRGCLGGGGEASVGLAFAAGARGEPCSVFLSELSARPLGSRQLLTLDDAILEPPAAPFTLDY